MKYAIVGGAKFNQGSEINFDIIIFQSNGYLNKKKFKYKKKLVGLQDFTLRFFEHNDKLKYKRYNKVYDMLYFDDEEIEMILHKSKTSDIFFFKEYSKINLIEILNHRNVIVDLFKFFGFWNMIRIYNLKEIILSILLYFKLVKNVNSNLRPSNGFYNLMRLYKKLDDNSQLHCFGFSKPDVKTYTNDYLNFSYRPHQKIDEIIFKKLISDKKVFWNNIETN